MNNELIYSMGSKSNIYMYMREDKVVILGQKEYYKESYNNTILSNSSHPPGSSTSRIDMVCRI